MFLSRITRPAGIYSNTSPLVFNVSFPLPVTGLELSEFVVSGGTAIKLSGSGLAYTVEVNPTSQGSLVTIWLQAGAVSGGGNVNSASNTALVTYNSIKPRPVISHTLAPITNSPFLNAVITFDRSVTGLTASDIVVTNAAVSKLSGSGSVYNITLVPTRAGDVSFYVGAGAATDSFGNTCVKSREVNVVYDSSDLEHKSDVMDNTIEDKEVLIDFKMEELESVSGISALTDCAKNIPQRLLELAEKKAFETISKNSNVQKLVGAIAIVSASIETISEIVDQVQAIKDRPETLLEALLVASGLSGEALRAKMAEIVRVFGAVSGLSDIIASVMASGICGSQDYSASGEPLPKQILTPTSETPPVVTGVTSPVSSTYDSGPKDRYDDFLFSLKESLEVDSVEPQSPDRAAMLSVVTTLAMGYHDDIVNTTDSSADARIHDKYLSNVSAEKKRNLGWEQKITEGFDSRTLAIGNNIKRNADVIRNFMNRNRGVSGTPLSIGVTTYSGPADDFTTFLDIKPSERPPELVAKYTAQGKRIPTGNTYTNSAGKTFKIGTLSYADAFTGAYGSRLVSDFHVASSRYPGGSVLALRNPDGSPYNPSGKNPSGQYTVTDTGNAELTYKKPDIFTLTPELYTNKEQVQVFLISTGSQKGKQYMIAQQRYGSDSSTRTT